MSTTSEREKQRWLRAVGEAVRAFRARMGVSQEALGYRAGFHRTYVSDLERGQRNPGVWTLKRFAETMGTTSSEVLRLAEDFLEKTP